MTDGIGLHLYSHDANGRLLSLDGAWDNDTITYQYNELGQMTDMTPQSGQAVAYAYDTMGRLTDIQAGVDTYTYGYSGVNSLVQSLTRPNGSVTDYSYIDALMRLTDVVNKDSNLQVINGNSFTYSDHDLIETETITNPLPIAPPTPGVNVYSNNNVNQLVSVTNLPTGRQVPSQSFSYDDDGNMTQSYNPEGYALNMTYDAENRLKTAEYMDSSSVLHRTEYSYSGNNLLARIKNYENGVVADETRFVRAEFLPLQERDGNNLVTREYLWGIDKGGGIGGLLSLKEKGQDYFYLYDGKGNVSAVMDSNEQVVASYRYDEFGNLLSQTGSFDQPFRFSTKQYDDQTGLSYYGYRYYSPLTGKWITRDPIGEDGGINLYGFVGNDAVNRIDPLGLKFYPPTPIYGNGNLTPGYDPLQDMRCTPPAPQCLNKHDETRNCCKEHDECYKKYHCNASSWLNGFPGACQLCNLKAVICIMIHLPTDDKNY